MKVIFIIILLILSGLTAFSQGVGTETSKVEQNHSVKEKSRRNKDSPLKIVSKPVPKYTEQARRNNVRGKVVLSVEFKKDGEIGEIKVVKALPDGLTESAISAARGIKFEPEIKDGEAVTVVKEVPYNFVIY